MASQSPLRACPEPNPDLERINATLLRVLDGLTGLRESVDRLAEAATAEPKKNGQDVASALRGLASVVAEGNAQISRVAGTVEGLPQMLREWVLGTALSPQALKDAPDERVGD